MVAAGKNKVSDKSLIPIDDEISTKFFRLFMSPNKLGRRETTQVASNRLERVR